MAPSKELPTIRAACWYKNGPESSPRLDVEVQAMRAIFRLKSPLLIVPPRTGWDVDKFLLKTHRIKLKEIKDKNYGLGWTIEFSLLDGHFCPPNSVWIMKIFYPNSYPYASPIVSVLNDKGVPLWGDKFMRRSVEIDNVVYSNVCRDQNTSDAFIGHNPAQTHSGMHALRGILWLRSYLYFKKTGNPQPDYA